MSTTRIEWEWGYIGRCFVNGKLSHGVRISGDEGGFQSQAWKDCAEPSGIMLGTYSGKTLADVVTQAEGDAARIEDQDGTLSKLKSRLREYPWHHLRGRP